MAEEGTDPLVTPAKSEIDKNTAITTGAPLINESDCLNIGQLSAHDRASIDFDDTRDNARTNPSEKPDSTKIGQHVVPHYLRASTGSCHDICKYGRRHEFQETARKSLRTRVSKGSPNEQNSIEVIVSGMQKEKVVRHELSAVAKKRSSIMKSFPDTKSHSPIFRTSLDAKASSSNKTRLLNSPTEKSTSLYPPEIIKREVLLPSKKVEVPGKEGNSTDTKVSRKSPKHSSSLKLKSVKVEQLSASDNSVGVYGKARTNGGVSCVSTLRKMTVSASAKKVFLPSAAPLSPKFSLVKTTSGNTRTRKLSSCPKGPKGVHRVENEISKGEVSEKTLTVIKIGTEKDALESVPDDCAFPVLPSPSLPNSLSRPKFPRPLSRKDDDEEIKFYGNEADEVVSDNSVSVEVAEVQCANENHNKTPGIGTENEALESIPNQRSLRQSLSYGEDIQEIEYNGDKADKFVSDNTSSVEIVKMQPVKEKRKKIPIRRSEKDPLKYIPDDNAALQSSSSSDTSCHASSSSLFSHEQEDEQITHTGSEGDEIISDSMVSMKIVKEQPMRLNHNKTLRKSRSILSEDKHRSPVKLTFRSGKVLDLKLENNAPRRLKFRRTRVNTNATDNFVWDNKKSTEIGSPQHVKENQNKQSRKSRLLVSKDKYRSPIQLFRTEKLVDIQSDNNSLRKLRFRRAREYGAEHSRSDARGRIFKRAGDKNDAASAELSSRKVTLKHQDLQGKRDGQGLLNNVIEETASKLVESRKSKVKALVGAFETLISLQERKPSLRSVS